MAVYGFLGPGGGDLAYSRSFTRFALGGQGWSVCVEEWFVSPKVSKILKVNKAINF